jgi:hypothetical protein
MFRTLLSLAAVFALGACNDPGFTGVPSVRTASAAEVTACAYVMDIRARPGVYGPLAQQGLEYSRNQVLDTARQEGANTVVFEQVDPGAMVTEIRATAYRC